VFTAVSVPESELLPSKRRVGLPLLSESDDSFASKPSSNCWTETSVCSSDVTRSDSMVSCSGMSGSGLSSSGVGTGHSGADVVKFGADVVDGSHFCCLDSIIRLFRSCRSLSRASFSGLCTASISKLRRFLGRAEGASGGTE